MQRKNRMGLWAAGGAAGLIIFISPLSAGDEQANAFGYPEAWFEFHSKAERVNFLKFAGRDAPGFKLGDWINGDLLVEDFEGKVVIVDFWATWCGPCVASIPHMNGIANRFRDDLVAVGISNEKPGTVQNFMRKTRMDYAVAVDQGARMQKAVGVRSIPHVIVISSDWVVRWQGNPLYLKASTLEQIIAADRALSGGGGSVRPRRWTGREQ